MIADGIPEPLSAKVESSFAYYTINARLPIILAQVADILYRKRENIRKTFGQESSDDLKTIIGKVSKLRYEVQTDKPILPLEGEAPDVNAWNAELKARTDANNGKPPTWYTAPWLYVECYMYRALCDFVQKSAKLQKFDIFGDQKQTAFWSSEAAITSLLLYLKEVSSSLVKGGNDAAEFFSEFLQVALWGNKCDLSITQGRENSQKQCILEQLTHLKPNILADETASTLAALHSAISSRDGWPGRVDIVLDNAGFELVTDLCFAEMLVLSGLASSIHFHAKAMPWFVSDVTEEDFMWTLNSMAASSNDAVSQFASRWKSRMQDGSWVLKCDYFWTLPYDFSEMKKYNFELYDDLTNADLIFFKGDLNFRKLSGDRQWRPATPFTVCLQGFHPAPLCSLRALKADVVTGLQEGLAEETSKKDEKWMINGNWATILFCGERGS